MVFMLKTFLYLGDYINFMEMETDNVYNRS